MLTSLHWYADKAARSGIASLPGIAQQCIDKILKYHETVCPLGDTDQIR
jgi:hypothetical protein